MTYSIFTYILYCNTRSPYCTCYVKKDKETVVCNFLCQVIVWTHYSLRTWVQISSYKLESSRRGLIGLRTETIVTAQSTGNTQWREMSTQRGNTKTTGTNKCQKQMSWQTKTDAVRSVLKGEQTMIIELNRVKLWFSHVLHYPIISYIRYQEEKRALVQICRTFRKACRELSSEMQHFFKEVRSDKVNQSEAEEE